MVNSANGKKNHLNNVKQQNRPDFFRSGSRDNVRRIVEKEGKTARNLVVWSVPSETDDRPHQRQRGRSKKRTQNNQEPPQTRKPTNNQKQQKKPIREIEDPNKKKRTPGKDATHQSKQCIVITKTVYEETKAQPQNQANEQKDSHSPNQECEPPNRETKSQQYQERIRNAIEKGSEQLKPSQRPNSAASFASQKNLRARYWSYLFDNFHRAVDEIYSTCEHDESILECKEVIMMLDVCKKDFTELIHRLELFNRLETGTVRPQSLAWEVRKQMSPGKCSPTFSSRRSPSPAAARFLNLSQQKLATFSWADRVRGFSNNIQPAEKETPTKDLVLQPVSNVLKTTFPSPVQEADHLENTTEQDDGEGWEVVKKGRSRSKGSNFSTSSGSSLQNQKKFSTNGQTPSNQMSIDNKKPTTATVTSTSATSINSGASTNSLSTNSHQPIEKSDPILSKGHDNPTPIKKREENTVDKGGAMKIENLSRSSTIVEEYFDYGSTNDDNLLKSTSSYNMETIDMAFSLTEDELHIKEEQEKALASVIAEEETLTKELEEEALKDVDQDDDISSERDYATSDGRETPKDLSDEIPLDSSTSFDDSERALTWEEMCQQYDQEHESGTGMDWGDMMELSESVRMPGRALEMHQKLSSPSRKKSRSESVKRSEERMARAERRRLKFLVEKCERLRNLSERVRKVRELKNKLIQEKEQSMLDQMRRAEINRKIVLQEKVKKAQEEELKVNEIAFINLLEAQNKRIEVQEKHQISEARLQELMEERQRRKEDKQAKEEAAQERRKQLEQERLARLQEIKQKRGNQAAKWEKERIERDKAREELAKERQRNRQMKVAARDEALQQATEELQKRIEQKHIDSTRRHVQKLTEVKEKSRAASSSRHSTVEETPSALPYEKVKKCTLCDVEIVSDVYLVSHLKGKKHKNAVKETNKKITDAEMEAFSAKYIKDVEGGGSNAKKQQEKDERDKMYKKRVKKLRSRMMTKSKEYESNVMTTMKFVESSKRGKLQKCIKEITKVLQGHTNGAWPAKKVTILDKALSDITRSLEGGSETVTEKRLFCQLGGLSTLCRILLIWDTSNVEKNIHKMLIPPKLIKHTVDTIFVACRGCQDNCQYMLLSNKIENLINILVLVLKAPIDSTISTQGDGSKKDKNKYSPTSNEISGSSQTSGLPGSQASGTQILSSQVSQTSGCFQQSQTHSLLYDCSESQIVESTMKALRMILSTFYPRWPASKDKKSEPVDLQQRLNDVVSYMVCEKIMENLVDIFRSIQGPVDDNIIAHNLQEFVLFLQPLTLCMSRLDQIFTARKEEISLITRIIGATELFGLVALMYSLLHQGSTTRIAPSPLPLADSTVSILTTVFKVLNILAMLDLQSFQKAVAGEGTSLQYRSVTTYLLRYTSNEKSDDLLHEVILNIGYFTVMNEENQMFIQIGRAPSLIQQLCMLPFGYFSDPRLKDILFPTLISACFKNAENKELLAQDVNPSLLSLYLEEKSKEVSKQPKQVDSIEQRSDLLLRFPKNTLEQAQTYFTEMSLGENMTDHVQQDSTFKDIQLDEGGDNNVHDNESSNINNINRSTSVHDNNNSNSSDSNNPNPNNNNDNNDKNKSNDENSCIVNSNIDISTNNNSTDEANERDITEHSTKAEKIS